MEEMWMHPFSSSTATGGRPNLLLPQGEPGNLLSLAELPFVLWASLGPDP